MCGKSQISDGLACCGQNGEEANAEPAGSSFPLSFIWQNNTKKKSCWLLLKTKDSLYLIYYNSDVFVEQL